MKIGGVEFDEKHVHVMGILNVTPDSFSDGGKFNNMDAALLHAEQMINEGAEIIDIGGESTRPGFIAVSEDEEKERVVPIIEKIKSRFNIPISIDTYKAGVAKEAVAAGADLVNDVWGLMKEEKMGEVIAKAGVPCCLMHNRTAHDYTDFASDYRKDIAAIIERATKAGIERDKIILDPGVGFAKTVEENLYVINHLDILKEFELPYLLGCSRKSVIGNTLNLPVDERLEGTLVTTVYAVLKGAMFVRVHDVKENLRAVRMAEAINAGI